MAALAMRRLPVVAEPPSPRPRLVALPGGSAATAAPAVATRSLDAALSESWTALRAGATVSCILCGGAMTPRWSAGAGVIGGRCTSCGTELD
jgi:hypothetical protein